MSHDAVFSESNWKLASMELNPGSELRFRRKSRQRLVAMRRIQAPAAPSAFRRPSDLYTRTNASCVRSAASCS